MMPKHQLGWRVLRDGAHGPDVAALQTALARFGYQPGPIDGVYGFLTEEAVLQVQRDFGLREDGIAGAAVVSLLGQDDLASLRTLHVVQPGDTVYGLAEKYWVSPRFFAEYHKIRRDGDLFPGRQLVIPVRSVYGWIDGSESPDKLRTSIVSHLDHLTALVVPWYSAGPSGGIVGKLRQDLWDLDKSRLFPLIPRVEVTPVGGAAGKRLRRRVAHEVAQALRRFGHEGVVLQSAPSSDGLSNGLPDGHQEGSQQDGSQRLPEAYPLWQLAREVRAALPAKKLLIVDFPLALAKGDEAGLGPGELASVADRIVVDIPREAGTDDARRLIKKCLATVPRWKLILRVAAGYPNPRCLEQLDLVNRFNLAGVALAGLGSDRELVWRGLADRFSRSGMRSAGGPAGNIRGTGA